MGASNSPKVRVCVRVTCHLPIIDAIFASCDVKESNMDDNITRHHKKVAKSWGWEDWVENNNLYCCKHIVCYKDKWSSNGLFHYHKIKDETFYVISGELQLDVILGDTCKDTMEEVETFILFPNESIRIKPNTLHRFTAQSDVCEFIETSTTHSDDDSYRVKVI